MLATCQWVESVFASGITARDRVRGVVSVVHGLGYLVRAGNNLEITRRTPPGASEVCHGPHPEQQIHGATTAVRLTGDTHRGRTRIFILSRT